MALRITKKCDQKTIDLVYGYIKRLERSLSIRFIPSEIYDVCLEFYYFPEYFDKATEDYFYISDDKLTIKCIDDTSYEYHTIYMKQWIHSDYEIWQKD